MLDAALVSLFCAQCYLSYAVGQEVEAHTYLYALGTVGDARVLLVLVVMV